MKDELLQIINHYGVMPQLKYLQSEVFELNEAIINAERYEEMTLDDKQHIAEEIADCCVFLRQFMEYYGITQEEITNIMAFKIGRQIQRIENETH